MEVSYTSRYLRETKKVPRNLRGATKERTKLFQENPFHPRLKTHKLSGGLTGYWAFSIDYSYRIIFEFVKPDEAIFHSIGDHSIYDSLVLR